jgi:hypothetical protein
LFSYEKQFLKQHSLQLLRTKKKKIKKINIIKKKEEKKKSYLNFVVSEAKKIKKKFIKYAN